MQTCSTVCTCTLRVLCKIINGQSLMSRDENKWWSNYHHLVVKIYGKNGDIR